MTPANVTTVKRVVCGAVHGHICYLSRSGQFHWRAALTHEYGQTAQEFASKIQGAVRGVTLLAASEHWHPWPKPSYFEVVFTVAPPPQRERKARLTRQPQEGACAR